MKEYWGDKSGDDETGEAR